MPNIKHVPKTNIDMRKTSSKLEPGNTGMLNLWPDHFKFDSDNDYDIIVQASQNCAYK